MSHITHGEKWFLKCIPICFFLLPSCSDEKQPTINKIDAFALFRSHLAVYQASPSAENKTKLYDSFRWCLEHKAEPLRYVVLKEITAVDVLDARFDALVFSNVSEISVPTDQLANSPDLFHSTSSLYFAWRKEKAEPWIRLLLHSSDISHQVCGLEALQHWRDEAPISFLEGNSFSQLRQRLGELEKSSNAMVAGLALNLQFSEPDNT